MQMVISNSEGRVAAPLVVLQSEKAPSVPFMGVEALGLDGGPAMGA